MHILNVPAPPSTTSMIARFISLRFWSRCVLLGVIGGVHQLPHVQHRRGGRLVFQGNDMEGEERVLLVRSNPCIYVALYASPLVVASMPFLVWMSVWTSRFQEESRPMLSTCAARGTHPSVGQNMGTHLIEFQARSYSRNMARNLPIRSSSCYPLLRRPHILARSLPQTGPNHQPRRRTSFPSSF